MDYVDKWRLRRRIEYLESIRVVGHTSLVTVLIRHDDHMFRIRNMITEELSRCNSIKDTQNRHSVHEGLKSIGEFLKKFTKPPKNGIACFYGSNITDSVAGKEKRLKMNFEPPRPISRFVYHCDTNIHTEALRDLLKDDDSIGFIVMDGKGTLFAIVTGNEKKVQSRFTVDLPRKHNKGGQSAPRFARLRDEMRKNYLLQVCEKATSVFISDDKPNVSGLVFAGQAQFKDELEKSANLDPRLKSIIKLTVTVTYGELRGLDQAIKLSSENLSNIRLITEIKHIGEFMSFLQQGKDDMVAYGVKNTIEALQSSAVLKLLVYENLKTMRYQLKNIHSEELSTFYAPEEYCPSTDYDIIETQPLIEWLADHCMDFGSKLELVSDRSQEGAMLKLGFDGIAAILRYSRVSPTSADEVLTTDVFLDQENVFYDPEEEF